MTTIKLTSKFTHYLNHFNQEQVMEALALCNYYHIYNNIDKNIIDEDTIKNYVGINYHIDGSDFITALSGKDYIFMRKGYLKEVDNLLSHFYSYKLAVNYPEFKIAQCPYPDRAKEKILQISEKLCDIISVVENNSAGLLEDGFSNKITNVDIVSKYQQYVKFCIKHILSYCSQFDKDFSSLGQQLFSDFDKIIVSEDKIQQAIEYFINNHLNKYYKANEIAQKEGVSLVYNEVIKDEKIAHIFNYLENKEKLQPQLIKVLLSSHDKGKLGEKLLGGYVKGDIVGHENKKVDIIDENNTHISLKTSYTNSWNHHLSYLNDSNELHKTLTEAVLNKTPLYNIKNIDWHSLIKGFISGNESIEELVFQKVILDEETNEPNEVKIWRINTKKIFELIENKQFIFQNNNIILFHNQDQVLKFNIKKRTDKIQIMVITDEQSLVNAVNNKLGTYYSPLNQEDKMIYSKISFK